MHLVELQRPILSDLLTHSDSCGDIVSMDLAQPSITSRMAVPQFYGRYGFSKQPEMFDMEAILQQLIQLPLE